MSKVRGWPLQKMWKSPGSDQKELSLHIKAEIKWGCGGMSLMGAYIT